jgi:serine/threonine-protein kinase
VFLQRQSDGSERLKLLDFGLAKRTQTAGASDPTLTRRGDRLGTPAYMSPEQIGGDALDARSDVYSAGVIMFEMLAGQLPFEGELAEQMRAHLVEPLPRLPAKVPPALDALVKRALAKKPAERFADAADMLAALEAAPPAAGASTKAPRTGLVARAAAGALLSAARILTALALVVIVLALSAIYLAQHRQAGPEHTGARDGTR